MKHGYRTRISFTCMWIKISAECTSTVHWKKTFFLYLFACFFFLQDCKERVQKHDNLPTFRSPNPASISLKRYRHDMVIQWHRTYFSVTLRGLSEHILQGRTLKKNKLTPRSRDVCWICLPTSLPFYINIILEKSRSWAPHFPC